MKIIYMVIVCQNLFHTKIFKWSNDLTLDPNNFKKGIYEVDIEIPENLHDKFKDYPLCPEIKSLQIHCR